MEEEEPSNIEIPAAINNNQDEEAPEIGNQDINPPQTEEPEAPQTVPPESNNDRGDPKLYVDVNIGRAGVGLERIVVFEGDTAESLA